MCCAEDKLTFSEIRERANLPEEDLVRILHSLSCSKYKILSKEPPTKTPGKTDTFSMNANFTDRMRRIRVRPCTPKRGDTSCCVAPGSILGCPCSPCL